MMERAELMRSDLEEDPFDVLTDEERDEVGEDAGEQWSGGAVVLGKDVPAEGPARGEVVAGVDDGHGPGRGDDDDGGEDDGEDDGEDNGGEGDGDDGVEPAGDGVELGGEWDEAWVESDGGGAEKEVGEEEDPGMVLIRQLVREFSVKTLAERTGIDEGVLVECHLGVREVDGDVLGGLLEFEESRPDRGLSEESGEESWEELGYAGEGYAYALDLDQDGVPDFEVPGVHRVAKGEKWSEMMERRRRSLWSARGLALMTQFRLGMTVEEQVAAVGFLTRVELVLIMGFNDTVPDPGASWDIEKRATEVDRRLARLRWVEEKQKEEYGGWKGVWRAVVGRKRVSGKELFQKMLDDADDMMMAMSGVGQSEGVMDEMMRLAGVGFLNDGKEGPGKGGLGVE